LQSIGNYTESSTVQNTELDGGVWTIPHSIPNRAQFMLTTRRHLDIRWSATLNVISSVPNKFDMFENVDYIAIGISRRTHSPVYATPFSLPAAPYRTMTLSATRTCWNICWNFSDAFLIGFHKYNLVKCKSGLLSASLNYSSQQSLCRTGRTRTYSCLELIPHSDSL